MPLRSPPPPRRRRRPPPRRGARAVAAEGRGPDLSSCRRLRKPPHRNWPRTAPALRSHTSPPHRRRPSPFAAAALLPVAGASGRPGPARADDGRGGTRARPACDAGSAAADCLGGPALLRPPLERPAAAFFSALPLPVRRGYRPRGGLQQRRSPRWHLRMLLFPPHLPRPTAAAPAAAPPPPPPPRPQPSPSPQKARPLLLPPPPERPWPELGLTRGRRRRRIAAGRQGGSPLQRTK